MRAPGVRVSTLTWGPGAASPWRVDVDLVVAAVAFVAGGGSVERERGVRRTKAKRWHLFAPGEAFIGGPPPAEISRLAGVRSSTTPKRWHLYALGVAAICYQVAFICH